MQQTRFHQGGGHADIRYGLALAVVDSADAVPDLEADVPQEGEERFEPWLPLRMLAFGQQHEHIDVGGGVEFAAAIAADGHQGQFAGRRAGPQVPRRQQHHVYQTGAVPYQRADGFFRLEALAQIRGAFSQRCPESRNRICGGGEACRQTGRESPVSRVHGIRGHGAH